MGRRIRRWMTVPTACLVAFPITTPALAAIPRPRSEQWWLRQWQAEKIWSLTQGQGVTVAVLDGGVNAHLPDLAGRVLPGGDMLGGGTNGLKDLDTRQHGTNIAGLIAAQGQGTGMLGIAPRSRILSIRMNNETHGSGSDKNMAAAIRSAVRQGAKVINISLAAGSDTGRVCDPEREAAVTEALQRDVIVVAGAGNNIHERNVPLQPAACPGVLAVGSLDRKGRPDLYSQPQSYVAVSAPGVEIASIREESFAPKGYIEKDLRGTSLATALVSGVVALVRSRYPQMPAREVLRRITATAEDVKPKGRDTKTGFGAVRPYEALTAQLPASAPNPVYEAWERSRRERALHPLPGRTQETIRDVVPLRTRMIQIGTAVGVLVLVGIGTATVVVLIVRRRTRTRSRPFRSDPGPAPRL
ncbi:type VII secretion-associated serine protease mycosin [Actinomadura rugatobispora]|uniref:Type VII secretion-associated serine protease mycosin n=1 Tax=Actinomadura rugatobispora TaxID=1994 RepID=A0ABW1A1G3_9ACTN